MTAYYNEINPHAAAWMRNLIAMNVIAPGDVDERSIKDVKPDDLRGYVQCHFFAGVGVWSYALRQAGWPDDQPVWTGSCPCQGFSPAGKRRAFQDERHLWPDWLKLIEVRRPDVIFGEQVADGDGLVWLDLVSTNLEDRSYAVGAVPAAAAGFGAPHSRHRTYFMADGNGDRWRQRGECQPEAKFDGVVGNGAAGVMGDAGAERFQISEFSPLVGARRRKEGRAAQQSGCASGALANDESVGCGGRENSANVGRRECASGCDGAPGGLVDANEGRGGGNAGAVSRAQGGARWDVRGLADGAEFASAVGDAGPVNGFWRDADWLFCRDELWRPVESGAFPLVDGTAFMLGSGRPYEGKSRAKIIEGYGNAIVAPHAIEFIRACMMELGS